MSELLVSICREISDFIPDTEKDLKTELGSILGTNNLSKSSTSVAKKPEKALNLLFLPP